jgi:hypothetical protein
MWFVLEVFEDGGFVEDSAGGAELDEVVGEEWSYECRISPYRGVEETFFELPELVGCIHTVQHAG